MRVSFTAATLFAFAAVVVATPHSRGLKVTGCSLAKTTPPISNLSLVVPSGSLEYVALGVGTQNYTCTAAGTYTTAGAVAELFDASCFIDIIEIVATKHTGACEIGIAAIQGALGHTPLFLGNHFFINNPTGAAGISPDFDFRTGAQKGNADGFVVLAKKGDVPAPNSPTTNIDWLQLSSLPNEGTLATSVYRLTTVGGQPPATCTVGSGPITVPYAATYWFYK